MLVDVLCYVLETFVVWDTLGFNSHCGQANFSACPVWIYMHSESHQKHNKLFNACYCRSN